MHGAAVLCFSSPSVNPYPDRGFGDTVLGGILIPDNDVDTRRLTCKSSLT